MLWKFRGFRRLRAPGKQMTQGGGEGVSGGREHEGPRRPAGPFQEVAGRSAPAADQYSTRFLVSMVLPITAPAAPPTTAPITAPLTRWRLPPATAPITAPPAAPMAASRLVFLTVTTRGSRYTVPPPE